MQKVPRSITIGGKRIKIRVCPELESWGEYHHDLSEIRLSTSCIENQETFVQTLRHEILEASLCLGGVAWSERYDQEVLVRCLESIFFPCWDKLSPKLLNP